MNCEQTQLTFGVYLLGVIDPAERAEVDRHLVGCSTCRAEFDRLAEVPHLLDSLRPAELARLLSEPLSHEPDPPAGEADLPSPGLLDRMLATAARQRRLRRRLSVLAAAALMIIVAGLSVIVVRALPGPAPAQAVTWTERDPGSGIRAEARLTARGWGTEIVLQLTGVPVGTECSLVALSRDGQSQPVGTWNADYSGTADVTVATSFTLTELESLLITNQGGEQLLRLRR